MRIEGILYKSPLPIKSQQSKYCIVAVSRAYNLFSPPLYSDIKNELLII